MGTTARDEAGPRLRILGATRLETAPGEEIRLRPRERALAAALALRHPRPAGLTDLAELLWTDGAPTTARKAIQNHVLRLRRAAVIDLVRTEPAGYGLTERVCIDRVEFEGALEYAAAALAGRDLPRARAALEEALAWWRGDPYVDLAGAPAADAGRNALVEQRDLAEERLATVMLRTGALDDALVTLERLAVAASMRERRWWLLTLAQYRGGRRRDALGTCARARHALADGPGLEPGSALRELERQILEDDDDRLLGPSILESQAAPSSTRSTVSAAVKPVDDEHGDDVPAVFVGRDAERTRIAGLTARTVGEGRGAVVVIRGDAGMGKTELARHVCADAIARGALVLWGTCRSDAPVPFQPFGEALGQLAREHPTLFAASLVDPVALSAILPELGEPPEPSTTIEQPGRYRVADAAGETLGAAARARGLLLVLDDLHEAPPATQRLASRSAEQGRLLVVATARNEPLVEQLEGTDEAVTRIDLPALTADDVQAFLALTLAADEISPAAAHFIAAETDGNPLFVRELTRALLASGALRPSAEGWIVDALDAVPATLSAALLERVSALPAPTRRALRAAAVLGRQFEVDQLVHMLGSGAAMLDDALRDGVIVRSGALQRRAFAHDLVRRTVYESIPEGARLELHELAAGALEELGETRTRDADVALHRLAAARLDPVRAVAAARRAGDTALARFSYEQAAEFYRRAHELVRDGSSGAPGAREACELAIRRGDALRQAGDARSLEVLLAAADGAERIRDGDLMAEAALALCYLGPTTAAGESDARVAAFSSRALARAHSARLRAQLAGAASLLHSLTGDPRTCRELFELAVREARAAADDQALAAVLPYAYLGLGDPDDLDRRGAVADELVDLARRLGHLTTEWEALQLGFSVMLQRGDPALDGAVARMDEIAAIVKEPARTWEMRYLRAARAHVHGRLDEAEAEVTRSLEDAGTVAESRVIAVYGAQMLAVRADQGRLSELAPAVEQLTKDQPAIAGWHAAMAMIAGAAGDRERATAEFDIAAQDGFADLPRDFIWTGAMTMLGFALDAVGDPERAAALYEHLAPYSGRLSWVGTCTLGPIDTALASAARLVHPERVQSHVAAAVALCERMNAPILRRRALANAEV